jgi:hypothetical protein
VIDLPAQFRGYVKSADELAHGAGICKYWACGHAVSFGKIVLNSLC